MRSYVLSAVAGLGALTHVYFAFQETLGWGRKFVERAAPAWINRNDQAGTDAHIAWAQELAFNVGVYNLVLAAGLAWTAVADASIRRPLGIFFSIWLFAAAAAAAYTHVYIACVAQGALGALLLLGSARSS